MRSVKPCDSCSTELRGLIDKQTFDGGVDYFTHGGGSGLGGELVASYVSPGLMQRMSLVLKTGPGVGWRLRDGSNI